MGERARESAGMEKSLEAQQQVLRGSRRRLLLMRHAKSSWNQPLSDARRPLNDRGKASAQAVSRELARRNLLPDLVLSSDARRTKETYEHMCKASPELERAHVHYLPEFYGIFNTSATSVIMDLVWEKTNALRPKEVETVLCLGHNDGWELALNELVDRKTSLPFFEGGELAMKTADVYVLEQPENDDDFKSWDDIFTSHGKWSIETYIRS